MNVAREDAHRADYVVEFCARGVDQMYVQYLGVSNSAGSRIYTFHVLDPPREMREFSVKIRSEEFCPGRLKFQDGPGISSARLQRELNEETQESRAEAHLCLEEVDIRLYLLQQPSQSKSILGGK